MEIVNNKAAFRFEMHIPGQEPAVLTYRWLKGSMVLMHTVVPPAMRGQGIAGRLVKYVLDYIRAQHLKMVVYCPFVVEYMKKNPGYEDLVDPEHKL